MGLERGEMTRSRDIGEFKGRHFVIATIIFIVIGLILYGRFDFRVDPKAADQLTKQQEEITKLEQRIDTLEKSNTDLQSEFKKIEKQQNACCKSHGPNAKPCPCQKP
jgi:septal ring factor EnvC (AmiA/AmiB activator)